MELVFVMMSVKAQTLNHRSVTGLCGSRPIPGMKVCGIGIERLRSCVSAHITGRRPRIDVIGESYPTLVHISSQFLTMIPVKNVILIQVH